ncbi:PREDICTED: DEAD-box ATP-dependent RNA helicase 7-like isoform X2 [Camelina sativa]|uniref:RNA helicase n=1 Tax=Camelina sativa TaxID=90675 RepID=A0ABM0VMC5_CAMSA|nr:PREDICTED: DEAD-box ATP-dependent RNA helicase 7-like isoform X1 [Camelina sativa]XP_010458382.1 PREDICTED: DEAD-box ATP-dependent RNA helicase 7-like isoform X2 [Camelina sativa]
MPSLILSDKKEEKKMKKKIALETPELDSKKGKKEAKLKFSSSDEEDSEKKKSKRKDKKRKAAESEEEEEEGKSDSSSEKKKKKKSSKKVKLGIEDVEVDNPNAVSKFRISAPLREMLKKNGIEALFPIQATTFDMVLDGADLVGRARTGQGKTLAFVLPILESLINGPAKSKKKNGYGRPPSVLVLLPTRELAKQVNADFETYGLALGLTSCCVYGGEGYSFQQNSLRKGVDIVVGTPGRVKDFINTEKIDLSYLQFRVLDEADEMLRMGFVEDVEFILGKVEDATKVQTLLFSATLPQWVQSISRKFLKKDLKTIDLVGNDKMKASNSVRHIAIPCNKAAMPRLIPDIISCYSSGGQTIIFAEKKEEANELSGLLAGSRTLHGDIQQSQREVTLAGFRKGKFSTLVATNVAARGLDINDVQLIIQCEPPRDVESYIHRSGRTGRAGNTGVAVTLYESRKSSISRIEKEAGIKFEYLSAPQPDDIARAGGMDAAEKIKQVCDSVVPAFLEAAKNLLESSGLSAEVLLAKALAKTAGFTEIKKRSLLTSMENHVTLHLEAGREIYSPSYVYGMLRRVLPEDKVERIEGLSLTADKSGAVFDVVQSDLDLFLAAGQKNAGSMSLEVVKEMPKLQEREPLPQRRFGRGGSRFGSGGGRGGGNRFGGGGGRGGRGGGRGGGRW